MNESIDQSASRRNYLESRTRDYTRFASLLGESLGAKVDLLAQVLGSVHEPSLGRYKERLLAEAISASIPSRYEVGNGFVLYSSDFNPSRQCDIIVLDSSQYPVVFRDGDFVIVRPESVRAVVEVKGSLSPDSTRQAATQMIDFGKKWQSRRSFYRELHESEFQKPFLAVMAWRIAVGDRDRPRTNGRKVREQLVASYSRADQAHRITHADEGHTPWLTGDDCFATSSGRATSSSAREVRIRCMSAARLGKAP